MPENAASSVLTACWTSFHTGLVLVCVDARRWTVRSAAALTAPVSAAASLSRWSSSSCRAAGQLASAWLHVAGIEQTPHWLARHLGDQVVVAVDIQHLGAMQFGGRGDDQVRDRAPVTIAAMLGKQPLDLQCPVHCRLADRQPLQCPLAREQRLQIFLVPGGVADFQCCHMARRDDVRAAQAQERSPGAGVSRGPFQRGLVREQHAQPRPPSRHAPRSASSDRSAPVSSRSSSMRAAARWFATRRRAAFTVATLLVVPSSSLASDSASSSRSTTVLDIRSSTTVISADEVIVYQSAREKAIIKAAQSL